MPPLLRFGEPRSQHGMGNGTVVKRLKKHSNRDKDIASRKGAKLPKVLPTGISKRKKSFAFSGGALGNFAASCEKLYFGIFASSI